MTKRPQLITSFWPHLIFLLFLLNYVVVKQLQLTFYAQSCLTMSQVSADPRCLYIYGANVYEKGTRNKPHQGQPCGTDVTRIIPSFHYQNMVRYMDPNLVGAVCSDQPVPTATPTSSPKPTATIQPTNSPIPVQPTATNKPQPTSTTVPGQPSSTPAPTARPTATKKPTAPSATPTPSPVAVAPTRSGTGFGGLIGSGNTAPPGSSTDWKPVELLSKVVQSPAWPFVSILSGVLVVISFIVMVGSSIIMVVRKISLTF